MLGLALVVFTLSGGRYWRWERIVLGLALFNGLFLLAAILVKPHVGAVAGAFDFSPFPGGGFNTLLLLLASTIGATVTPWMIFFQQSASADKGMTPRDVRHGRYDTGAGRGSGRDLRDRRADRRRGAAHATTDRASRGSRAPGSPRRSSTSRAAPSGRCSRWD